MELNGCGMSDIVREPCKLFVKMTPTTPGLVAHRCVSPADTCDEPSSTLGEPGGAGVKVLGRHGDVLAVEKPANLPSVPGRAPGLDDCVWHRVQRLHPKALVVHRLDMATSGVMLFALTPEAQRRLSWAFESRRVIKHYEAQVHGLPNADEGAMDWPLGADWPRRPRQQVDATHGRPALTRWRVIARDEARARTRMHLEPLTGRSHQLRVHLLTLGHPIVGDRLYGPDDDASRLHLHACRIEIPDPGSDDLDAPRVVFHSEIPFWS